MLFNSYEYVFAFLPLTAAIFMALGTVSRTAALRWLILASIFFYAWWRPLNVLIIAPSILVNFALARQLIKLSGDEGRSALARSVLIAGIVFNVAFLGYFKYTYFLGTAINDLFGSNLALLHIVLPLGISFITFQKIAFLIDSHAGRVKSITFQDYCLFVLFFPQLIAGPIVHHREMMPQFHSASCRFDRENVAVGLTLFFMGLFKKVVCADNIAMFVSPIYGQAAAGHEVTLLFGWVAAVGFTLQIYFDFSGYTDMALGSARLFGIRLPPNFDSPLRTSSIIDFWLRWHMTLTRFLTAYIYNPLVLALTRRRFSRGLPGLSNRNADPGAFLQLLALPTLLTMFISGVWHGAGYQFICWGLLHGAFISVNHAWRTLARSRWPDQARYARWMGPVGLVLTFVCVAVSMVLFRSPSLDAAGALFQGMLGLNGVSLPAHALDRMGAIGEMLVRIGVAAELMDAVNITQLGLWLGGLLILALAVPNTLQILSRYEPALGVRPLAGGASAPRLAMAWSASLPWAIAVSLLAFFGVLSLGGQSEFLYWQF